MNSSNKEVAVLVLSDGTFIEGNSFGFKGTVFGELVFNTGMTGYQEVMTDPSYFGQLVVFTYPELGNTGINLDDQEADKPSIKGVVARHITLNPSNWRSTKTFESWLKEEKVVGISGVDTRALVRHLREHGTMNAVISTDSSFSPHQLLNKLKASPSMEGLNLAKEVATTKSYTWERTTNVDFDKRRKQNKELPFHVVAIDFGIKRSILERLVAYGCRVSVLPCTCSLSEIINLDPDGVFFSNGPGDPASVKEGISLAKSLIEKKDIPLFGICLGHQILGLALGGKTFKLGYGHRGLNHPCGKSGLIEITSQNHGFALDASSLNTDIIEITHMNLNDQTVAGFAMRNRPVFGIQYHPEASPGPHDADHHFARFVTLMEERRRIVV